MGSSISSCFCVSISQGQRYREERKLGDGSMRVLSALASARGNSRLDISNCVFSAHIRHLAARSGAADYSLYYSLGH